MNHEEYVEKQKAETALIAQKAIKSEISILVASRKLSKLLHEIEIDEWDEDFLVLVGIDSETDRLPLDEERKGWAVNILKIKDKEINDFEEWAKKNGGIEACKRIYERFKDFIKKAHNHKD